MGIIPQGHSQHMVQFAPSGTPNLQQNIHHGGLLSPSASFSLPQTPLFNLPAYYPTLTNQAHPLILSNQIATWTANPRLPLSGHHHYDEYNAVLPTAPVYLTNNLGTLGIRPPLPVGANLPPSGGGGCGNDSPLISSTHRTPMQTASDLRKQSGEVVIIFVHKERALVFLPFPGSWLYKDRCSIRCFHM